MNDKYTYEIFEDGYDIFKDGQLIITQRVPYDKLYKPDGTYEENAIAQIDSLNKPVGPSIEDTLRADIDYMAIMLDIDLPSEETEEEGE